MTAYRLTERAEADLGGLYEHGILAFGLRQADLYFDGLVNYFGEISQNPNRFVRVDQIRTGYRRAIYGSHAINFRVAPDVIVIVRILGRQDPNREI